MLEVNIYNKLKYITEWTITIYYTKIIIFTNSVNYLVNQLVLLH